MVLIISLADQTFEEADKRVVQITFKWSSQTALFIWCMKEKIQDEYIWYLQKDYNSSLSVTGHIKSPASVCDNPDATQ